MSTFSEIQQLFPKSLQEIAKELGYPESTICVISGDEKAIMTKHPSTYSNIQSCGHNRDARTPLQYAMDLAASWIMEDYLIKELGEQGLSVSRVGEDRERLILSSKKVSSNSDCMVEYNGLSCKLELMNDYKGYWNRTNQIDLRDDKFVKMGKEKSLFLGVSTKDKKYLLLNFSKPVEAVFSSFHFAYHKPAYSIKIKPDMLKDLDFSAIANDIIKELSKK